MIVIFNSLKLFLQVVSRPDYLDDPIETSRSVWEKGNRKAAPNGAVMRCSAVALVYYNDLERVIVVEGLLNLAI